MNSASPTSIVSFHCCGFAHWSIIDASPMIVAEIPPTRMNRFVSRSNRFIAQTPK